MNERNDGGPAFPLRVPTATKAGVVISADIYHGMTLRDYFAAQAMASVISKMDLYGVNPPKGTGATGVNETSQDDIMNAVAKGSYSYADAMLAARVQP